MKIEEQKTSSSTRAMTTEKLVKVSILSAMAFIIMMIEIQLPIFPEFLKIDLSEIPALIGGFAMGPVVGIIIELVKNVLHLLITKTAGIGEMANFIVGASLVFVSSYIYKKNRTKKGAVISLLIGTIVMSIVASLFNYLVLIPLYEVVLKFPISAIVAMSAKVTSAIVNLETLVLFSILPFNLLKGAVVSIVVFLIYKKVEPIIKPKY
ncbi:ECF transporter S component [Clostridium cylindrosporum]|uniref:Riboflavin transporter n=1 Tax=Clostridium cylindrosporum DSM 605 TaxID=1121307 RepID=A0A0J8DGK7_CLOCY|nr:ECF transporter S component [Clostridium cylindrosporum]KMT23359.1 riboflavin transporter RibU [Clostridium cylindrosporum DSM 605]